ncbi:MAG: hypothetical protein ABI550_08560, partial [Ignavibacteriaceae bacterium]
EKSFILFFSQNPKKILPFLFFILSFIPSGISAQDESEIFLEGSFITSFAKEEGYLWIATYSDGIFRYSYKDNKWINFSTKNKKLENDLFGAIAVNKDYVWAATNDGLFTYDKKRDKWRKRKFALGGEMGNWIRALTYDPDKNYLWIGRFKNLTLLDVRRQRYLDFDLTKNNDAKTNNVISVCLDGDSLVWFGTESGVHIYDKGKKIDDKSAWNFINNKKGFLGDGDAVSVSEILFESTNVWFGTDEFVTNELPQFNTGGIYRFDRQLKWDKISKQNGLAGNGIYSLERTGNKIWASLYSFNKKDKKEYGKGLVLINRFNGIPTTLDLNKTELNTSEIHALFFDGTYMWIGTTKGLWRITISNPLAKWYPVKEDPKKKTKPKK